VAIPDAVLLVAMGRDHARIHIEHDASWRTASMHAIDPLTGKIARSRKVLFSSEPARLEAAHLACLRRASRGRFPADDPTHRGIVAEPLGVFDILVSGQATEDRLPQHTDKSVTAIIAGARVSQPLARHRGKAECVVKFAIGRQPRSRPNRETGASIAGRNRA
jgi:hypothetical protein